VTEILRRSKSCPPSRADASDDGAYRRAGHGATKWLVVAVAVAVALYLSVPAAAYIVWVATSAFLGVRDDPGVLLGVICVIAAVAHFVAGAGAYLVNRASRSRRRGVMRGAVACAAVGVLSTLFAVLLMGPF
jgi:hypothetical protein